MNVARSAEISNFASHRVHENKQDKWVMDSGATVDCTGRLDVSGFIDRGFKGQLRVASNKMIPIEGKGNVSFQLKECLVKLAEVIYVPMMVENLLSLNMLLENGLDFRCDRTHNYQIFKEGQTVAKGRRENRTSYLNWVAFPDALFAECDTVTSKLALFALNENDSSRKQKVMHRRFGHPGMKRYNHMVMEAGMSNLQVTDMDESCEVCIKAKKTKTQNHAQVPKSSQPLTRVFIDF